MIEGITLLEIIPIMRTPNWIFFITISGIICLIFGANFLTEDIRISTIFIILGVFLIITSFLLIIFVPSEYTGKSKYIVRIDDNVNTIEFLNKYEIIEHEKYSNIYTIKEL